MALARIPLPSFTLVLTSGPQSVHRYPTAIRPDSSSSAMRLTARGHLMQTIGVRGEPNDSIQSPPATRIDNGRINLQTTSEEEDPSTSPAVDKKQAAKITKQYVLMFLQSLRRKLFSPKGTVSVRLITN